MRYWKWILMFAVVVVAIVFSFLPQTMTVEMGVVSRGDLFIEVEEDGRTRVRDRYTVNSPINGMLRRPNLKAGDPLVAGESVIAILDPTLTGFLDARSKAEAEARVKRARAARDQARQQLRGAETSRDFAKTELERLKGLGGFASEEAVDMAAYTLRLRESEVLTARKALNVAEFEMETQQAALASIPSNSGQAGEPLVLTSPVTGAVFRVFQESRGLVTAGTPIMEVGDPTDLEMVVDLLSKDAVNVQAGQKAKLLHWGGGGALGCHGPPGGAVRLHQSFGTRRGGTKGQRGPGPDRSKRNLETPWRWFSRRGRHCDLGGPRSGSGPCKCVVLVRWQLGCLPCGRGTGDADSAENRPPQCQLG